MSDSPMPDDQLDCFDRLHHTDDPRQHAQHAAFGAARHHARRRRFREHAAIARPAQMRGEHRALPLESENRAVDIRLFQKDADVIRK